MTHLVGLPNTAIYSALSGNTTLNTYVGGRISPNIAAGGEAVPYVTYSYAYGGELNNTQKPAFEIFMDVTAVADTQPKAATAAGYIRGVLKGLTDPSYPDSYKAWGPVRETWGINQVFEVQGRQFWIVGSTYRFRGILE